MTVATLRPDGWPQATTVGYVNEGLTLYFLCGLDSQKAKNLARDDRLSLTIDHDTADLTTITGLSMAAHAHAVDDRAEAEKVLRMLPLKYPDAPPRASGIRISSPADRVILAALRSAATRMPRSVGGSPNERGHLPEAVRQRHWIISSARNSSDCGRVGPSAFAVFKLMVSSNLDGCSTGRSAAFAPLRILST